MNDKRTGEAKRIDALDRPRPSELVTPEVAQRRLRTHMGDSEGWYRDRAALRAQRLAHGVIVSEAIGKRHEAADLVQRPASKGQGRAKARASQAQRHTDHDTRQEVCVDG